MRQQSLFPEQIYAVLCTTTVAHSPRVGLRERQPGKHGYWTAKANELQEFSFDEATAKVASLKYNQPQVVRFDKATKILNDQYEENSK